MIISSHPSGRTDILLGTEDGFLIGTFSLPQTSKFPGSHEGLVQLANKLEKALQKEYRAWFDLEEAKATEAMLAGNTIDIPKWAPFTAGSLSGGVVIPNVSSTRGLAIPPLPGPRSAR